MNYNEIFSGDYTPDSTYVSINGGKDENMLISSLSRKGSITLLTGASKTGKTTLSRRAFNKMKIEPIVINCSRDLELEEIWKIALREVDYDEVISRTSTKNRKIDTKISVGWWKTLGLDLGGEYGTSSSEVRRKVVESANPSILAPILFDLNRLLVFENLHYLKSENTNTLLQQLRVFTDNRVSILLISTHYHLVNLSFSNPDLIGRLTHVNIGRWRIDDLKKIVTKGFNHIDIGIDTSVVNAIGMESVGLPNIAQFICGQILGNLNFEKIDKVNKNMLHEALYDVAQYKFPSFEHHFMKISLSSSVEDIAFAELLAMFNTDPVVFELSVDQILIYASRSLESTNLLRSRNALKKFLNGLENYQFAKRLKVVEYFEDLELISIIQPSFIFFIRWRSRDIERDESIEYMMKRIKDRVMRIKRDSK